MKHYKNLPHSHNSLKTFEAVARRMSFTHAAFELNVTQSAVSRQVKQLEEELAVPLIERHHRAITLTPYGENLYQVLKTNYGTLEAEIARWRQPEHKRITIKAALSYSTRSLIPKIHQLYERYPEHEIVVVPSLIEDEELESNDYDLLILTTRQKRRYENQPDMFFMREEYMAPVCAQSLASDVSVDSILTMPSYTPLKIITIGICGSTLNPSPRKPLHEAVRSTLLISR